VIAIENGSRTGSQVIHDPRETALEAVANALLSGTADAIIAADKSGRIVFWNPGAERLFGYRAHSAIGQSLDIIIPEKLRKRHWEGYSRVMQAGVSRYGDGDVLAVPGIKQDGSRVSLEFTVTLLRNADGSVWVSQPSCAT
jgi:PAS domain S-box-containing protein